ncbi:hypothetical protein FRC07_001704 [Ceratobasidium sp. 392]|nr:hypothetical protein FRC07_001704 [Ceratobasidium sp. 392]
MPRQLPTELLTLIAGFASQSTLANLALTSKTVYRVSIQLLYSTITSEMDVIRAAQCLDTLATNSRLARLVRSYHLRISEQVPTKHLFTLLARAFRKTTGLTELFIQLDPPFSSDIFKHATFKLCKLICCVESSSKHSIGHFLNTQPELESLSLFCHPEDLDSLSPTALPILKNVTCLPFLLPDLLSTRLSHIERILWLGTMTTYTELCLLRALLRDAPSQPTTSIELVIAVDFGASNLRSEEVELGLSLLGREVPWIGSLRLDVHRRCSDWDSWLNSFAVVLRNYPRLHTLAILTSPQSEVSTPTSAYIPPDPLHDASQHMTYLKAWRAACPTLDRIMFPVGVYKYDKTSTTEEARHKGDCLTCHGLDKDASHEDSDSQIPTFYPEDCHEVMLLD